MLEKRVAALEERMASRPADPQQLESASIEELIDRLDASDAVARYHAAQALGGRLAEAKIDLFHVLKTGSHRQREAIAALFASHATPEMAVDLVEAHAKNDGARVLVFLDAALGRTEATEAVEPLAADLAHPSMRVRVVACEALGKLGDAHAAIPLAQVLAGGDPVLRPLAVGALRALGPVGVAYIETQWHLTGPRERLFLLQAAAQVEGSESEAFLADKLQDASPLVALEAARLLALRGSLLGRDVAVARVGSEDPVVRAAARTALDAMENNAPP
jgi:HEAT repeat protein